jgi:hypothetical protein
MPQKGKFFSSNFTYSNKYGKPNNFSKESFLQNLIFTDKLIHGSSWFEELPTLLDIFGPHGLIELINKGDLVFHADALTIGSIGQSIGIQAHKGVLPLGSYRFSTVQMAYWEKTAQERLEKILTPQRLEKKVKSKLSYTLLEKTSNFQNSNSNIISSNLDIDLRKNHPSICTALEIAVSEIHNVQINREKLLLKFDETALGDFRCTSNLRHITNLNELQEHKAIERAILSIGGIHTSLFVQQFYDSAVEVGDTHVRLLNDRYKGFHTRFTNENNADLLKKVLEIGGLPSFEGIEQVDPLKLIELKRTDEYICFINWLNSLDPDNPKEIEDQLRGFNSTIQKFLHSNTGKTIRILVQTGLGATMAGTAGIVGGIAMSIGDMYLTDKLFPQNKVAFFLQKQLPTIFST